MSSQNLLPVGERLGRIRALLSGLTGPYGNGEMHVWVNLGDVDTMPRNVFALIEGLGVVPPWNPEEPQYYVPVSSRQFADCLAEIDEERAVSWLIRFTTRTLAYGTPGRYDEVKAADMFGTLVRLLGYGTRWWTNTDGVGWMPVTRQTFDRIVIGVGNGITVAVLVYDED